MPAPHARLAAALAFASLLACGGEKPPAPAPAAPPPRSEPAPAAPTPAAQPDPSASVTVAERPAAEVETPPARPVPAPAAKPAPVPAPAAGTKPAPVAAPAPEAKPAARSPAAPAASAHAKVGADKCRMCHRVQHQSWAESAHAKKGLDCEGCHGDGGDYWPAAVMRDRAKAVAAGLVPQGLDRCRKCHPKADASLLPKAHAHKPR